MWGGEVGGDRARPPGAPSTGWCSGRHPEGRLRLVSLAIPLTVVKGLTICNNVIIMEEHSTGAFCPVYHRAIELIGRRWTGAILRALLGGERRFSDVRATIPGLSDRLLSERLKELEAARIVTRVVVPDTPVRVEYRLTEKGRALSAVVAAISEWAATWAGDDCGDGATGAGEDAGDQTVVREPTVAR